MNPELIERIQIVEGDITQLEVDGIVNAANNALMGGGGVDGAIHRAAGPALREACKPYSPCPTGHSVITSGFNLPSTYVIHTVGPVWYGGDRDEPELLRSCYQTSLELAEEHHLQTIAFPSISTGAYRYPFQKASLIAFETIVKHLSKHDWPNQVLLVAFGKKDAAQLAKGWSKFVVDDNK